MSVTAPPFRLDARRGFGGRLAYGQTPIAATADGVSTGRITAITTGDEFTIWDGGVGAPVWDTTLCADGWFDLTLHTPTGATARLAVLNGPGVHVREETLTNNQTWTSNAVQVVRHWVVVPSGRTLSITPGTVVKFCDETGIQVRRRS